MGFELERIGENVAGSVKRNPTIFIVGGLIAGAFGLFAFKRNQSQPQDPVYISEYPEAPKDSGVSGGVAGQQVDNMEMIGELFGAMQETNEMLFSTIQSNNQALMENQAKQYESLNAQLVSVTGSFNEIMENQNEALAGLFEDFTEYQERQDKETENLFKEFYSKWENTQSATETQQNNVSGNVAKYTFKPISKSSSGVDIYEETTGSNNVKIGKTDVTYVESFQKQNGLSISQTNVIQKISREKGVDLGVAKAMYNSGVR